MPAPTFERTMMPAIAAVKRAVRLAALHPARVAEIESDVVTMMLSLWESEAYPPRRGVAKARVEQVKRGWKRLERGA